MDKLRNMINMLDWVLNVPIIIVTISMLRDAINRIFIYKNYKRKFATWSCFICTILFIIAYIAVIATKTKHSWDFLLGAIIFLYAIVHENNIKKIN